MPNGEDKYNPKWCQERHSKIKKEFEEVWGQYGFGAVWKRMDSIEAKLWWIIIGLVLNLGGIITMLLKLSIQ